MIANRYGEEGYPPFRTQRLFSENGQWYFDTREGTQLGPYHDLKQAKQALALFVAQRLLVTDRNKGDESSFVAGSQDGIEHMVEELFNYLIEYKSKGQTSATVWAGQRLRDLKRERNSIEDHSIRMEAIQFALDQES
ncbi:MAG: DUF6316 family protein [Candidatus Thiodiazotropha sp.]